MSMQIAESTVTVGDMDFKSIAYRGYSMRIYRHQTIDNPRNHLNNLGSMIVINRKYPQLGDRHNFALHDLRDYKNKYHVLSVPIYLYEDTDGSLYVSCSSFKGRKGITDDTKAQFVGYNLCTFDDVRRKFDIKLLDSPIKKMAHDRLEMEVMDYNFYLSKMVFSYEVIAPNNMTVEQCITYYGQYNDRFINKLKRIVDDDIAYFRDVDGIDKFSATIDYAYGTNTTSYHNLTNSIYRTHSFNSKKEREAFIRGVMNGIGYKNAKVVKTWVSE